MITDMRVGLVLSGGGAKGAYQVGVVKALAELGARVDAVAGASIGALNGAILASSPSLEEGGNRLEEVWRTLAETSPLEFKAPNYLNLLVSAGLRLNLISQIGGVARAAHAALGSSAPLWLSGLGRIAEGLDGGVLRDSPLRELMDRYLDVDALHRGIPLYVSAFRSRGAVADILSCVGAELGFKDSPDAEFFHIQSLPEAQAREALLASAAIPLLFAPKQLEGKPYSDGGQGGWARMQGNTPISPLLDSGHKLIIVTHLSDGSLWRRQDFPDATILEIRPIGSISRSGGARDLLGFDAEKISSWIEQGYEDALTCIRRVSTATATRAELRTSEHAVQRSETSLALQDEALAAALARLR